MLRSLRMLCDDKRFSDVQRRDFKTEANALLVEGGRGKKGALFCLTRLWQLYDVGGHSIGRSPRSLILEKIQVSLRGNNVDDKIVQKARTALSILVAMYYDFEYINEHGWFDFHLEDINDLPLSERILVSAAALALDVDEIPSLEEWTDRRIITFINGF